MSESELPATQNTTPYTPDPFGGYYQCKNHREISRRTSVYVIQVKDLPRFLKIGVAANTQHRLDSLQSASPFRLEIVSEYELCCSTAAYACEKKLHGLYAEFRGLGEWFEIDDPAIRELLTTTVYRGEMESW